MNYGYVRVSTTEQNIDRQIRAMNEKGIEHIYVDKFTGISFDRPNYEKLRRRMKSGDVLFVKSLDRFGRKYTAVLEEWRYLAKKGVAVVVMDMPILDTRNKDGNLMGRFVSDLVLQILSFVAEQEYRNIHERQRQGIEAAKAAGVRFGRPPKPLPENFFEAAEKVRKGKLSIKRAGPSIGMPTTTFYTAYQRYLNGEDQSKEKPLPICPYLMRVPNAKDCLNCTSAKCDMEDEKEDFEFREPYKKDLESERIKAKERRERRKAEGLCPTCGLRPPEEGKKNCRECLDRANGYYRYKQIKKARMRGEDDA